MNHIQSAGTATASNRVREQEGPMTAVFEQAPANRLRKNSLGVGAITSW